MSEKFYGNIKYIDFTKWILIGSLVFGGCCSNVIFLELIIGDAPKSGKLITFAQFLFISFEGLLNHLQFSSSIPHLKPRAVPIYRWIILVVLFFSTSILNNTALGYEISLPFHIIFRSGGLIVSMILGWAFIGKKYSFKQIVAVIMVTFGVVFATLSSVNNQSEEDEKSGFTANYIFGLTILTIALVLSCFMGLYQEMNRKKYENDWREGLFYTHILSLPLFLLYYDDIKNQVLSLNESPYMSLEQMLNNFSGGKIFTSNNVIRDTLSLCVLPKTWLYLIINILTQYICISGVHRLHSISSALTVNFVLNLRKFISLILSVLFFGNDFSIGMGIGGVLVFIGTILYSIGGDRSSGLNKIDDEIVVNEYSKKNSTKSEIYRLEKKIN